MATTTDLHSDEKLARLAADIARQGYMGPGKEKFETRPEYARLVELGSELWLDTGDEQAAADVWSRELSGLTTNNTLINQVIQTGRLDETIQTIGRSLKTSYPDMPDHNMVIEAAFILNAHIALSLVERFGAKVSVELHPDLADNWQATVAFGQRYFDICPENFIIKVPMTPDGLIAVRKLSDQNIPVNFTLGFSVRQNYFAAAFSRPAYVNIFLGRLGNLVQESGLGDGSNIGEHVTLASQEAVEGLRNGRDYVSTRQIAASLRSGDQVATLAGVDVQTIPPKAARQYLDSGVDLVQVVKHTSGEVVPALQGDDGDLAAIAKLWEVPDEFVSFTNDANTKVDQITSGSDLLRLAEQHGVSDFFRHWSVEEQLEIRKGGKIPDFHRWKGVAAADDLMSQAALQSFAVDQGELDSRISRLISQI